MGFYPCFVAISLLYANEQGSYLGWHGGKTARVPLQVVLRLAPAYVGRSCLTLDTGFA